MRIAYLIDYDINTINGVMQKIIQQTSRWIALGHTVYFVSSKSLNIYNSNKRVIYQMKPLSIKFGRVGTALKLLHSSYYLDKLFKNIQFDILYMRYRLYMPFFSKVLKKYKVIMEINSDDTLEYKLHSKVTHIFNKYTRFFLLKYIDAFISVSYELKDRFFYLNKPIDVIANGICISGFSFEEKNPNDRPTLVFIGTPNQPWHGIEKIEKLANFFNKYQFYVIGINKENCENIKYFGYLKKEESIDIIKNCDIGIGTLSLYKTGLTEASPLKTRQYLACGLPLIYAYNDTDFSDKIDFALRLENKEDNIDYDKISKFIEKVFNNKSLKKSARKFAENTLNYDKKEEKRLNFFKRIKDEK